ncbi:TPA: YbjN domain-containing protein, partial [Haemophilus influenzae]
LKEEGYSINVIQDNFLVFRLQGTNVVVVPHDGGDIQFCIMYDDDENRFSLRKVNKINIDYRLGKFYLTDDDKLGIELLLRNDGNGVTKSQIIQGLSDISLLNGLAKKEFW